MTVNENIISAIMQNGTIKEAAAAAGVSTRTIYEKMRDDNEFRQMFALAKSEVMRRAVMSVNGKLSAAIDSVYDIMTDKDTNSAIRLQAAQTILNYAAKFADRLSSQESHMLDIGTGMDLESEFRTWHSIKVSESKN